MVGPLSYGYDSLTSTHQASSTVPQSLSVHAVVWEVMVICSRVELPVKKIKNTASFYNPNSNNHPEHNPPTHTHAHTHPTPVPSLSLSLSGLLELLSSFASRSLSSPQGCLWPEGYRGVKERLRRENHSETHTFHLSLLAVLTVCM